MPKKGAKVGVNTAYTQQIGAMIAAGDKSMDPRSRILSDIQKLIATKRSAGFRPILMLDANDDWTHEQGGKQFRAFMDASQLHDPLHHKFEKSGLTPTTYSRGTRRIDYILVDAVIAPAIRRIGTLGLHEGIISDHVMLYMDCNETELFRGIINRPVITPCREFVLEHADKCEKFIRGVQEYTTEKKFKERVVALSIAMKRDGATNMHQETFQRLDMEIQQCLLSAARKATKKKFGYQRSPQLTRQGLNLHFWKAVLSAKRRGTSIPAHTIKQATKLDIDIPIEVSPMTKQEARRKVREARQELWEVQKAATAKRVEWLERNAQDIARAAGEADWKKKMTEMARLAEERGVHRQMTQALKGMRQGLNHIEVPIFRWFHSDKTLEIYKYDSGVFEAYAPYTSQSSLKPTHPTIFYSHHHLKALPDDATPAHVVLDGQHYRLIKKLPSTAMWREVTDPLEIERLITNRNKRHLQQTSIEDGRIHTEDIQKLMAHHGTSDLVDDLYAGRLNTEQCTDEAIQAWLRVMRKTKEEIELPRITGEITLGDFQSAFKAVKEKTSSSPSGLHYSIWKCLAKNQGLSEWLCVMMSLPFQYGFTNKRWTKSVDVMLEKTPGVRQIHKLRIIGLVEADFNTALKILFARKLMWNAEKSGLHGEQWGGRTNRTAIDAAMRKMMTFEYGRYMKCTIALFANDQTACFDRMCPPLSNVIAGKFGMDVNVLKARSKTMAQLKRYIKTNLGVSNTSYSQHPTEPIMHGEYQGKGDVASLWVMHSSTVLQTHAALYRGLALPDVVTGLTRDKNNDTYVDDADTWASSLKWGPQATRDVMSKIARGAQLWTNCQDVCGGATAFDKCAVQCLSWEERRGSLHITKATPSAISLQDIRGASSTIKRLRSDEPNVGLGFSLTPDGNQRAEFKAHLSKVTHVCRAAVNMMLTEDTAATMLRSRLIPKMQYGLHLSQFSERQCKKIDTIINKVFLPRMRIHSKTPLPVLYGPLSMGGLASVKDLLLQDQTSLTYIIQALRWDDETSKDILHTLNSLQIASGYTSPIMENTAQPIKYLADGWLLHIRSRLRALQGSLWIELAWYPELQRVHDKSLMEEFNHLPFAPRVIRQANECRIWLHVITIAELATMDGRSIPLTRMNGEWRATSTLQWPNQPTPTPLQWAAFRKCIRESFCVSESPWQRRGEYTLDQPLGEWLTTRRHIEYEFYRTPTSIIARDTQGFCEYTRTHPRGHFGHRRTITHPPKESHPIMALRMSTGIWTHRAYRASSPQPSACTQPVTIHDSFQQNARKVDLVSDASVHTRLKKAAVAWILAESPNNQRQVVIRKQAFQDSTSYRLELEGIYDGLLDAQHHLPLPTTIKVHCDCQSGIQKLEKPIRRPRDLLAPEMDVIMAINTLRNNSHHDTTFHWVRGHADDNTSIRNLPKEQQMNVLCDHNANTCVAADTPENAFHPLPGSRAMLRLGDRWVTSQIHDRLREAHTADDLQAYAIKRLAITEDTYHTIAWDAIGRVQRRHKPHRRIRTVKMLWRWLPVGHNWRHHGATTDVCPGCGRPDETFDHLLQCEHPRLKQIRDTGVANILRMGKDLGIPLRILHAILRIIRLTTHPTSPSNDDTDTHATIQAAIASQLQIGNTRLVTGFLSVKWLEAIIACPHVKYPVQCFDDLLALIWDNICEPTWHCRNSIFHQVTNHATSAEETSTKNRLLWYLRFQHEVLDYRHRFLVDYDQDSVATSTRPWRRTRLRLLDRACSSYATECKQRATGQQVITRYLINHIEDADRRPTASHTNQGNAPSLNDGDCDPLAMGPSGPLLPNTIPYMASMAKNVHNTLSLPRDPRD